MPFGPFYFLQSAGQHTVLKKIDFQLNEGRQRTDVILNKIN